jgi:hypothetical protein
MRISIFITFNLLHIFKRLIKDPIEEELKVRMKRILTDLCDNHFKFPTEDEAAKFFGVPKNSLRDWKTGKTLPKLPSVVRMKNRLYKTIDEFLQEETIKLPPIVLWMFALKSKYKESPDAQKDINGSLHRFWPNHEAEVKKWLEE